MCANEELKAKHLADIRSRCMTDDQAAQVFYLDTIGYKFCDERPKCIEQVFTSEVWMCCMYRDRLCQVQNYARVNGYGHIDYFDAIKVWRAWDKRQSGKALSNPKGTEPASEPEVSKAYIERVVAKVTLSDGSVVTVSKFMADGVTVKVDDRYMIVPPVSAKTRKSVIRFVEVTLGTVQLQAE